MFFIKFLKFFLTFLILLIFHTNFGQSTFILNSIPNYTPEADIIYLAGDITSWQPADPNFSLTKIENDSWAITLSYSFGTNIQFKFTRGSWETVEKGAQGEEIQNRTYTFPTEPDTVYFNILNWADEGGGGGGGSTAAENVHIVDDNFYMPQLNRNRRVWIYLPPDYETSGRNYPVLYMHDGQNLFDNQTSFAGEWEVDETLNELAEQGLNVPIVVGIDNGGAYRIDEYLPWVNPTYGGGYGEAYTSFLVNTLKPYIDENYRTNPNRENTAIMGSSLGGVISHYAAFQYPDIYSKAGIFSPAYWISDSIWEFTTSSGKQYPAQLYLLIGSEEGPEYVSQMWAMKDTLTSIGFGGDEVNAKETPGAQHNEYFWRNEFAEAYTWFFNQYANSIENYRVETVNISPNPVNDIINLNGIVKKYDSLEIVNIDGKTVLSYNKFNGLIIDVRGVTPGTNILILKSENKKVFVKFIKL